MVKLFWLQFRALIWKNWVLQARKPFLSILRCFLLPIAYGVFLSFAQFFLNRLNNFGIGEPVPILSLQQQFDGVKTLYWTDATTRTTSPTPTEIMAQVLSQFTPTQRSAVKQLDSPSQIPVRCPQSFNGLSSCYAAISFSDMVALNTTPTSFNYTIFADPGLNFVDVVGHTSDFETRILPLQWAIDRAIIELETGIPQETPLEWPFTNLTNTDQINSIRLSYVRGIRELIGVALFLTFTGISYQIPGSVASERALLITEHMQAMGLLDSARILSWHIGISVTYLPAWIIISLMWSSRIFTETSVGLIIILHILLGLVLASWSLFVAAPFGNTPQLAAVVTTFLGVILTIIGLAIDTSTTWFTAICGYENHSLPADVLRGDPDRNIQILPLLLVTVINIFLWPFLAVLFERYLYDVQATVNHSKHNLPTRPIPTDTAISIQNLTKVYKSPGFTSKGDVTAVSDLSLDIPKNGIFVMLGSNGAGKSTSLSIVAGLSSITTGTITFEGGYARPPRGVLGIVPQKNVLFPDLTCLQTLKVWQAVKFSENSHQSEDLEQLLIDCDLEGKIHANADTLSGGQKRKLQLAIGLLGGSKVVLVDECTSGVDPLSRRALWKILTSFREDRTIVFTTHFLDEADLLADRIAILAAPGKVLAEGSPVALKRDLGEGYSVQVSFAVSRDVDKLSISPKDELLDTLRTLAPQTYLTSPSPSQGCYHLKTKDSNVIGEVLDQLEYEMECENIKSYDILGTTIEDVFLDLMAEHNGEKVSSQHSSTPTLTNSSSSFSIAKHPVMDLPNGRIVNPFRQAFTIFHKRVLIARRSWLTPVLTILIAVAGACIPLIFIKGRSQSCALDAHTITPLPLFLPISPLAQNSRVDGPSPGIRTSPPGTFMPHFLPISPLAQSSMAGGPSPGILTSPPGILSPLGNILRLTNIADNATFMSTVPLERHNLALGGISVDVFTGNSVVAWEASPPGIRGSAMLNLLSNVLYNRALDLSGMASPNLSTIATNYAPFSRVSSATLVYLKWLCFFGGVMAVYPAFYALYVSQERRTSVQAMQLSNGLTNPVGLWLGHLMFDTITTVILSTVIIIIFATLSDQFHGLGALWFVFVLYGITAALFSYCLSLMAASPLAAFAIVAGYQFIMFVLYLSTYLLIFTFGKVLEASRLTTITHLTTSILAPVTSVVRATLVSTNLFSLLCSGPGGISTGSLMSINKFGGPILYLIVNAFILLAILVWVDSGTRRPRSRRKPHLDLNDDSVAGAESGVLSDDLLRVVNVSKSFNGKKVTDDVSMGIPKDTIFALLGPNGAGKTTTFNMIRGDIVPEAGDIFINGASVVSNPQAARTALGVCPQFTAIDSQLTVREHLMIYGRLKGLKRGSELEETIESILRGTSLFVYADRLANRLSGGNQRKLSLAIALMGNPPVILIDEFSTGVDPKMKRDMWHTLRRVAVGKAIVITTHSMEEASALANNVGILAKRMLAIGTLESLSARYATYEVQFTCRTREEVVKARKLMNLIPGSRMADDVATRFEVPITQDGISLAELFKILSSHGDFTEYTVERASLESVFLKVIKANDCREGVQDRGHKRSTSQTVLG